MPLTKQSTLERLLAATPKNGLAVLTVDLVNPNGYGRMLRVDGKLVGIVEQKDSTPEQLLITEVNTGYYGC